MIDGENAVYYQIGDIEGALQKIESLTNNLNKFHAMAKSGRKVAESRAWRNLATKIVDIYS